MRILLITHFFPPTHNAGTENYTLGLAQELKRRDHQVYVLCAEDWSIGRFYWNGVTEDKVNDISVYRIHINWQKASDPNQIIFDSLPVEKWLNDFLSELKPDLIHVTSASSLGVGILRSAKRSQIPLVLTLMDFWFLCPRTVLMRGDSQLCNGKTTSWECQKCLLFSSTLYKRLQMLMPKKLEPIFWERLSTISVLSRIRGARGFLLNINDRRSALNKAIHLPDLILTHSRFVKSIFDQVGLAHQVTYLPNGHALDWTSKFIEKKASPVVRFGYTGQINNVKGIHVMIDAFRSIENRGRARLDIWGDLTKDVDYSRKLISQADNAGNIFFRGSYKRDQLSDVFSEIDILIVPSIWYENAPLVIWEAFATKTPVIATNLGGMSEVVVHDVNGLLFERGNIDDLARQLNRVTEENGLLEKLSTGIPPVKSIKQEVDELENIYEELVNRVLQSID